MVESIGHRTVSGGDLLVSGNAPGVDQMAALGGNTVNPERVELCLPWETFESKWVMEHPRGNQVRLAEGALMSHVQLANQHCLGDFSRIRQGVQKLLIRNAMMLLTALDELSDIVIAWPNMEKDGWSGTGHTIRMAGYLGIPVWLANQSRWWGVEEGTKS